MLAMLLLWMSFGGAMLQYVDLVAEQGYRDVGHVTPERFCMATCVATHVAMLHCVGTE
jgi:hypothetical protein